MILSAIYKLLTGSQDITNLVGNRVFWDRMPQGDEFPCIVISEVTTRPLDELSGLPECDESVIQVDAMAREDSNPAATLSTLSQIENQTRTLLEGLSGSLDDGDQGTIHVHGCSVLIRTANSIPPSDGSDTYRRHHSTDYRITHNNGLRV